MLNALRRICRRRSFFSAEARYEATQENKKQASRTSQQEQIASILVASKACIILQDVESGKRVHSTAAQSGCLSNIFVANTLVNMYAKCERMVEAQEVFNAMVRPDVVSWTALIMGYVENGQSRSAVEFYNRMVSSDCTSDARAFLAALTAYASLAVEEIPVKSGGLVRVKSLEKAMALHCEAAKRGFEEDLFVASALIDLYAKCGSLVDARRVFDRMPEYNVVSWTCLMMGYVENGEAELGLELFSCMQATGLSPSTRAFVAAIVACGSLALKEQGTQALANVSILQTGMALHSQAASYGFDSDIFVANSLLDMYAKCGSLEDARRVFEGMRLRNVVSWTSLIQSYAENGEPELALELFASMEKEQVRPNTRTFVAALTCCASLAAREEAQEIDGKLVKLKWLEKGMALHSQTVKQGCDPDIFLANTLIHMYAKCGSMVDACKVFSSLSHCTVVSWTAMALGYVENGENEQALEGFSFMKAAGCAPDARALVAASMAYAGLAEKELQPDDHRGTWLKTAMQIYSEAAKEGFESDIYVANGFIDMYAKFGEMLEARKIFNRMLKRDVVTWNTMIWGCVREGENKLALELFLDMQQQGCAPNGPTYAALVTACGNLVYWETGRRIHAEICRSGLDQDQIMVATTLLEFYAKCGSMVAAQHVFDSAAPTKDVVLWNALIAGYSAQGDAAKSLNLFTRLRDEGIRPNSATFQSILAACSCAGLVETGKKYLEAMLGFYGIAPGIEHYACVIDLLGRASRIHEALDMVKKMPYEADSVVWTSVLGACCKWSNRPVGEEAFAELLGRDDKRGAAYVLMSNLSLRS